MSLAEIETAMRPFGQVDAGFNKRHEGTGLGLPIAYALARLHGGDLQIESKKGAGTRVTVILPMAAAGRCQRTQSSLRGPESMNRTNANPQDTSRTPRSNPSPASAASWR